MTRKAATKPHGAAKDAEPKTKKIGLRHSMTIDARFGSDHQRTVAIRVLDQFIASWKAEVDSRHKNNSITIVRADA